MGPTPTIEQRRAAVAAASSLLAGLGDAVVAVGNDDLGPFLREVDDLARQMEAARVALLAEALSRGVVAGSDCATAAARVIAWALLVAAKFFIESPCHSQHFRVTWTGCALQTSVRGLFPVLLPNLGSPVLRLWRAVRGRLQFRPLTARTRLT